MTRADHRCDVVVVGAGPAGSTAAYHLAEPGTHSVLIVDRVPFPRHKACGGALLGSRDWSLELPNYAEIEGELRAHSVDRVRIHVDRRPWWEGRGQHFFDQVHRIDFDDALLRAALAETRTKNEPAAGVDRTVIEKKKRRRVNRHPAMAK